jgi:hypothetical protein
MINTFRFIKKLYEKINEHNLSTLPYTQKLKFPLGRLRRATSVAKGCSSMGC